ncbi:MAG: crossover junction endodeoxyribonuclease RuvC, partial [Bacteroidetes bacterium]|nr:crossover junction endodeoxyribonuclease RuvC [Bacteroidota bacterium]
STIEELFFSKNVKTAMQVAQARGAIMQKLASAGYEISEYKPQAIKEAVCGYGRADKKQVQKMVEIILCMDHTPKPDDAADALGAAICHANSLKLKNLCKKS